MNSRKKGGTSSPGPVFRYERGRIRPAEHEPVREFPLSLIVNGRELATLISSPHELRFLVAGFLRLQGFVSTVDDFQMLSVCDEFGVANVILKHELPERLKPALTSGCGTGITFNLHEKLEVSQAPTDGAKRSYAPDDLFAMMEQLARRADEYRKAGGIHSAAVGDEGTILLYSEDIGRHNTLDRIAGEALLKGIDLTGKVLITSGRVSSEMVTKAAMLGVGLIASRTSPTDLAVRLADQRGITLVGYLRGAGFNIYTCPDSIRTADDKSLSGVTAVILAGGNSSRMKSNKALLPYSGELFIERIYRQLAARFSEVLLVTNTPELYRFLPCRTVPDVYPGKGSLAGIHAGLTHSNTEYVFTVACDMPYLNDALIKDLSARAAGCDAVIPESGSGLEPLHAIYGKGCLPAMELALTEGKSKIVDCLNWEKVVIVKKEEVAEIDPDFLSFRNINTPEEYFRFREEMLEKKGDEETEPASARR